MARRSAPMRPSSLLLCLAFVLAPSASAFAQSTEVPSQAPALSPPRLESQAEAIYPEEARAQRLEGTVILRLGIDAHGNVTAAEVVEPAGHGFDEAAQEAALRLRFAPALRDGQPVPSRIRFPFEFKPEPESAARPVVSAAADPAASPALEAPPAEGRSLPPAPSRRRMEVTVRGEAARLQQSAEAVNVIDTRRAKQQTTDLGEVLARTQGVAVRRTGGLGSTTRFSLNGLYDDQVRFFLNGVPLELSGFPLGVANVPVNLIDRVEVYRGVVPIRFGADALGGAVNLVSDQSYRSHLGASYQVGSFGTHRLSLDGRYHHVPSGFIAGASGFLDAAQNDYKVRVQTPDAQGRLSTVEVPRFHDWYRAWGTRLEVGVIDRPWARKLLLQGFTSVYDKALQNNLVMTVPYGEVTYGEQVSGATARYEVGLGPVELELLANYAHRKIDFDDASPWVYDWFGSQVRPRRVPGELQAQPSDQTVWQDAGYGRALLRWAISPSQLLRLSLSPAVAHRWGRERLLANPDGRDPLSARRDLFTLVSGLEYELNLFGARLSNILFAKDYVYRASSEEALSGGIFRPLNQRHHALGAGDSLRFRFTPWLFAKASYEYATRLPQADEVFGNGVLIQPNLALRPELSHNLNLGPRLELQDERLGEWVVDVNAFARDSSRLIVLLGDDRFYTYQNVYRARGIGLETALSWSSPSRLFNLDGALTWQDVRNASSDGIFKDFKGDRIPNRPYLFGSWGGRLRFPGLPGGDDTLEPFYVGRYTHSFFRAWESQGLREFKQVVDSQVSHSMGVSWVLNSDFGRFTSTFEVDNLADARLYDNFGVQRPGRAFYFKVTGEI